uniref:Uncharacterized protein n=1 Tax=Arundo donax TaxID=35708 RepID=A0A0A9APH6_ARUDO
MGWAGCWLVSVVWLIPCVGVMVVVGPISLRFRGIWVNIIPNSSHAYCIAGSVTGL